MFNAQALHEAALDAMDNLDYGVHTSHECVQMACDTFGVSFTDLSKYLVSNRPQYQLQAPKDMMEY